MKPEEQAKKRREMQEACDHLGEMVPAGQQQFRDEAKGLMVLITTLMCKPCGLLFFNTQETTIKFRVNFIGKVQDALAEQNGKN